MIIQFEKGEHVSMRQLPPENDLIITINGIETLIIPNGVKTENISFEYKK